MTPITDIEKLERLLAISVEEWTDTDYVWLVCVIAPSLIADWKEMRGEIERLTKERDKAYERAAKFCQGEGCQSVHNADLIRALKARMKC